jgi:hypothetical protein
MALNTTINIPSTITIRAEGFAATENKNYDMGVCYVKVTSYSSKGGKVGSGESKAIAPINFDVSIVNEAGQQASQSFEFTPSVEVAAENFIKQAYEHLKTLPEFADAVDV